MPARSGLGGVTVPTGQPAEVSPAGSRIVATPPLVSPAVLSPSSFAGTYTGSP